MAQFPKNQSPLRRIFYSRFTLIILGVVLVFMVSGTWKVYQRATLAKAQKERLEQEIIELEKRRADLEEKLQALTTERGVEEELRERYSVVKKGESVVVVVDEPENTWEIDTPKSGISLWWEKLLGLLGRD